MKESADLGKDIEKRQETIAGYRDRFIEAMDDDFNSANAMAVIFDLVKTANLYLEEKQTSKTVLQAFLDQFDDMAYVLGIKVKEEAELLDEEIEQLIEERIRARKNRNFARADEIREQLKNEDIMLEDTPQGTRWKRG